MKGLALIAVVLVALVAAGCLQAPAQPTPAPTDEASSIETNVDSELSSIENELGNVDALFTELDALEAENTTG